MVWAEGAAAIVTDEESSDGQRVSYIVEIVYCKRGESSARASECVGDVDGRGWMTANHRWRYQKVR